MKEVISKQLSKITNLNKNQIKELIEIPPSSELGDYAFPCFILSRKLNQNPAQIAQELSKKIRIGKEFEKVQAAGPYLNFFTNKKLLAEKILKKILKEKSKFGS